MPRLALLIIAVLGAYTAGTIVGPPALITLQESAGRISPFFLLSLGVVIASLGYAVTSLRGLTSRWRKGADDEDS